MRELTLKELVALLRFTTEQDIRICLALSMFETVKEHILGGPVSPVKGVIVPLAVVAIS